MHPPFKGCFGGADPKAVLSRASDVKQGEAGAPYLVEVPDVEIRSRRNSEEEHVTGEHLRELLSRHDLSPWLFARVVLLDEDGKARPYRFYRQGGQFIIRVHARFRGPEDLLRRFIHEQLHVHLALHPTRVRAAVEDLRRFYPKVPVGAPDGAKSELGTYQMLLLGRLERDALERLLDRDALRYAQPHQMRFVYNEVENHAHRLRAVLHRHGLTL